MEISLSLVGDFGQVPPLGMDHGVAHLSSMLKQLYL